MNINSVSVTFLPITIFIFFCEMTLNEQASQRLEETGYLRKIRAQMKAEVMKTLVDIEEDGQMPSTLKVKRYEPDDDNANALAYVGEFFRFHGLNAAFECLCAEVNGPIMKTREESDEHSELAVLIRMYKEQHQ